MNSSSSSSSFSSRKLCAWARGPSDSTLVNRGLSASEWIESARGCFYGLTPAHGTAHLARAVLESYAFAMRDVLERLRSMEVPVRSILLLGGGAKSRLWAQIRARPALHQDLFIGIQNLCNLIDKICLVHALIIISCSPGQNRRFNSLPVFTARAELSRGAPPGPLEVHDMSNAAFRANAFDLN